MLCTLAYVAAVTLRVPVVAFPPLFYEPKDVIILIGGFIYGPTYALIISFVVAYVEMVTINTTWLIGFFMNIPSSGTFTCIAAFIYKNKRTQAGAAIGLVVGGITVTAVMLLWNYIVTPAFLLVRREVIAQSLIPVFLPYNLMKSGINAGITMLLYRPVVMALRKAKLLPVSVSEHKKKINIGMITLSIFVIASCVMLGLVLRGVI
jgi:riboflavin transporter FmnP